MIIQEQEFLERVRIDRQTLQIWIEEEWLLPKESAEGRLFSDLDLARANLIVDLRHNMGVNDAGLDVILHLLDQLHGLRRAMSDLRLSMRDGASQE
jgi:chaperone modulatory protein CbpM